MKQLLIAGIVSVLLLSDDEGGTIWKILYKGQ
jgi:hypothetical protein